MPTRQRVNAMPAAHSYDRGSYVVDPPKNVWKDWEDEARALAVSLLIQGRDAVSSETDAFARAALPHEDLNYGAAIDGDEPETPSFAAEIDPDSLESDDWAETYVLDDENNMENKTAVLYGFEHLDPDADAMSNTTGIRFFSGTGDKIDELMIDHMYTAEGSPRIALKNPIVLDVEETLHIEQYIPDVVDAAEAAEEALKPHIIVSEKVNSFFGRSDRFWNEY